MSNHGNTSKNSRYIFVSGGVLSGLGKGITAASLGLLLKNRGYSVTNIKCENYLNLDSGNINPIEHGDVFLCEDGLEADLDLGSYERFLGEEVGAKNFTTMGQIYSTVIQKTRDLHFNGVTVDAIPYVPEEVIRRIKEAAEGFDIILVELGGTAGEYQNAIYYEAYRIMKLQFPEDTIHIHVTYFPKPPHINEMKSKPTQLSVKLLNGMGIQPEFIVGRAEVPIDDKRKEKVAYYCNLEHDHVISNPDCDSIYEIPLIFADQHFDRLVLEELKLGPKKPDLSDWKALVTTINAPKAKKARVAIIAKYIATGDYELKDSYVSLVESLNFASWYHDLDLQIDFLHAEQLESKSKETLSVLKQADGIIVPIGWGERGVEGKIKAITHARKHKVPYLGLCYGMQLACIEFARNVAGLKDAHTSEVRPDAEHLIIHDIPFEKKYQRIKGDGASMRLGAYDCILKPGSLADSIYKSHNAHKDAKQHLISERHRHRYEFNNHYREILEKHGLVFSGTSPDNFFVEMIELPKKIHPFFVATQAHPEYKSRPLAPHPLFIEFLTAVLAEQSTNK
ncbi:MAG: CTP synthase [Patescibacteria group bacterium]